MPPADNRPKRKVVRKKQGGGLGVGNLAAGVKKAAAAPAPVTPAPRTDVQASGQDYGTAKATAYKATQPYKRAVTQAKQAGRQQLAARYTHTGPAKTVFPGHTGGGLIGTVIAPIGIAHALSHGDLAGAVAAANPAAPILKLIHPTGKLLQNSAKDAVSLAQDTVPSTVHLVSEAAHGNAKGVAKDLVAPYKQLAQHPLKTITQHPLNSYLMVAGAEGAVGRGAGAIGRRTPIRAVKAAATTKRAPAEIPGAKMQTVRTYSPDVIHKGIQVAVEKGKARKIVRLNRKAQTLEAQGKTEQADVLRAKAVQKSPTRMTGDQIKHRVDQIVDVNQVVRARHAHQADVATYRALTNTKSPAGGVRMTARTLAENRRTRVKPTAATSLVAQRITDATKEDLQQYLDEIKQQHDHGDLSTADQARNKRLQKQIGKAIKKAPDMAKVEASAQRYEGVIAKPTAKLVTYKMLDQAQAERAPLIPPAVRRLGAEHVRLYEQGTRRPVKDALMRPIPENVTKLKDAERALKTRRRDMHELYAEKKAGAQPSPQALEKAKQDVKDLRDKVPDLRKAAYQDLPNQEILASTGGKRPAFVSQRANINSPGSFYKSFAPAKTVSPYRRTGEATRKGTFDASPNAMRATVRNTQELADAHEGWLRFLNEVVHRDQTGRPVSTRSFTRAQKVADDLNQIPGGHKWRVVRESPLGASKDELQQMLSDLENPRHGTITDQQLAALQHGGKGDGPWTVIPEVAAKRMEQHLRVLGSTPGKTWNVVNSVWRRNVLAFSTKWAMGNLVEAGVRSAVSGTTPVDWVRMRKVVKQVRATDPEMADALEAQIGSGHYGFVDRNTRHTSAQEFANADEHTAIVRGMARVIGTANRTPVVNWLPKGYKLYTDFVMKSMGAVEQQFRVAMAGKYVRSNLMDDHTLKLSQKAVEQAARGLVDTPEQAALADYVRRAYGQYEAFSPLQRKVIANYTPFLAWTINSVRFLTSVLPKDHPVLTGVLADVNLATEEWRKQTGIDTVPLWMRGSLPQGTLPRTLTGGGAGPIRASRYTPFGIANSTPGDTAAQLILPQLRDVVNAFAGKDWKGDPLKGSAGSAIASALLASAIPAFSPVKQIREKGANQALNPFAPTTSKATQKKAKSGIDWGGQSGGSSSGSKINWGG